MQLAKTSDNGAVTRPHRKWLEETWYNGSSILSALSWRWVGWTSVPRKSVTFMLAMIPCVGVSSSTAQRRIPLQSLLAPIGQVILDDRESRQGVPMAADFTPRQGQFLAFIYYYTKIHRIPPPKRTCSVSSASPHRQFMRWSKPWIARALSPVSRASPGPSVFSCPETSCRTWNNGRLRCQSPHSLVLHSVLLRIVQGWLDPDEVARWPGGEVFLSDQGTDNLFHLTVAEDVLHRVVC